MKKIIAFGAAIVLAVNLLNAQVQEVFNLEPFENVILDGNIRLYLSQGDSPSMTIEARRASKIEDYEIEVCEGTLVVRPMGDVHHSPGKINIDLRHTGIDKLQVDGLVKITTVDALEGERLTLKGDGLIRGQLEVDVRQLNVALDGLCIMTLSGKAEESDLRIDGLGKIQAEALETTLVNKSADGLASIRVGN